MLPLTVGPRNCEAATGVPWRWLREHAAELGVAIVRVDGKSVIVASELLAALERYPGRHATNAGSGDGGMGTGVTALPPADDRQESEDELAAMRRRVARAG